MTRLLPRLFVLSCLLPLAALSAEPPTPFQADYRAEYMGMKANAERSLERLDGQQYELRSRVRLRLLGKTLTEIDEVSRFSWQDGRVWSQDYRFVQSGLGKRSRSVRIDWQTQTAQAEVNGRSVALRVEGEVFDELNGLLGLRQQLAAGAEEVALQAIEKDSLDTERYRVLARESLDTALGPVEALRLQKLRGPDSERLTQIWLAPAWDYLLVKLYQRDPDGRELTLELADATLDGQPLGAR